MLLLLSLNPLQVLLLLGEVLQLLPERTQLLLLRHEVPVIIDLFQLPLHALNLVLQLHHLQLLFAKLPFLLTKCLIIVVSSDGPQFFLSATILFQYFFELLGKFENLLF